MLIFILLVILGHSLDTKEIQEGLSCENLKPLSHPLVYMNDDMDEDDLAMVVAMDPGCSNVFSLGAGGLQCVPKGEACQYTPAMGKLYYIKYDNDDYHKYGGNPGTAAMYMDADNDDYWKYGHTGAAGVPMHMGMDMDDHFDPFDMDHDMGDGFGDGFADGFGDGFADGFAMIHRAHANKPVPAHKPAPAKAKKQLREDWYGGRNDNDDFQYGMPYVPYTNPGVGTYNQYGGTVNQYGFGDADEDFGMYGDNDDYWKYAGFAPNNNQMPPNHMPPRVKPKKPTTTRKPKDHRGDIFDMDDGIMEDMMEYGYMPGQPNDIPVWAFSDEDTLRDWLEFNQYRKIMGGHSGSHQPPQSGSGVTNSGSKPKQNIPWSAMAAMYGNDAFDNFDGDGEFGGDIMDNFDGDMGDDGMFGGDMFGNFDNDWARYYAWMNFNKRNKKNTAATTGTDSSAADTTSDAADSTADSSGVNKLLRATREKPEGWMQHVNYYEGENQQNAINDVAHDSQTWNSKSKGHKWIVFSLAAIAALELMIILHYKCRKDRYFFEMDTCYGYSNAPEDAKRALV